MLFIFKKIPFHDINLSAINWCKNMYVLVNYNYKYIYESIFYVFM